MITAGHVLDFDTCSKSLVVFGVDIPLTVDSLQGEFYYAKKKDVYRCKNVIARRLTGTYPDSLNRHDYAVFDVDPILDRPGLELSAAPPVAGHLLATIGHPFGLSKKTGRGGLRYPMKDEERMFDHTTPSNPGSSGSPVIDLITKQVVGIHVEGPYNQFMASSEFVASSGEQEYCIDWKRCDPILGCTDDYIPFNVAQSVYNTVYAYQGERGTSCPIAAPY